MRNGIDYADLLKQAGISTLKTPADDQPYRIVKPTRTRHIETDDEIDLLTPVFRAVDNVNGLAKAVSIDPAILAALLASLGGTAPAPAPAAGVNIGQLISLFLPMLIALVQSQLNKPAPTPAPTPAPEPEPLPVPGEEEEDDPFAGRVITSFALKPFWYQKSAASAVESKEGRDAVLAGTDPMIPRSRFAVDCDILDQFGREMFYDATKHEAQINRDLWFGALDSEPDTHRMRWFFEGGDGVAEINESGNGFVPKIKIGKDALVEDNRDYSTGRLYGIFSRRDGKSIRTPFFPALRAKR